MPLTFIVSDIEVLICEIIYFGANHIINDATVHFLSRPEVDIVVLTVFTFAAVHKT